MKKQYTFIIMIIAILYLFYLIISFTYKEYKINANIEYITKLNFELINNINKADNIIKRKKSKAYINKELKEQQSLKNKWEKVIYLTSEKKYNKFAKEIIKQDIVKDLTIEKNDIIKSMSIYQKWIYLIFKNDIR